MAVIAVNGQQSAGIIYTHTTASSADWGSVGTDIRFLDLTTKLVYYKDINGNVICIGTPSASSNGIWGVSSSLGVYTFYTTYALALAQAISISATSIELFGDIIISSGTSLILTNGININGNGHTINCTLSTISVFEDNNITCTATVDNLNVIHTGVTNSAVYIKNGSSDITWNGRLTNTTDGSTGVVNAGTFRNAIVKASTCLYSYIPGGAGALTFENCTTYGINSGSAIRMYSGGYVNNCKIYSSNTHYGVSSGGIMNNCTIIYTGSYRAVILGGVDEMNNCSVICTTGIGVVLVDVAKMSFSKVKSSTNIAVFNGSGNIDAVDNCVLESLTTGVIESNSNSFNNCTLISYLAPVLNDAYPPYLYNCTLICNWNNAGGHAVGYLISGARFIDCIFIVKHASAVGFYAPSLAVGAGSYYYTGIKMNGSVNLTSPVGITNLITNTADAQGNIIIN